MSFEHARAIADAVLLEGYALYPYRASSRKNQFRWAFGVLAPQAWSEGGGCEPWWMETQCLLDVRSAASLDAKLRFLQVRRRVVERASDEDRAELAPSLDVDGRLFVTWDEGEVREIDRVDQRVDGGMETVSPFEVGGQSESKDVVGVDGTARGRVVTESLALRGNIRTAFELAHDPDLVRLRIRVENVTPWTDLGAPRERVLLASFTATHLLLSVSGGTFLSLLDPPHVDAVAQRFGDILGA